MGSCSGGTATATCNPGDAVTGGGFDGGTNDVYLVEQSFPGASAWTVTIHNYTWNATANLIAYAVCADLTP